MVPMGLEGSGGRCWACAQIIQAGCACVKFPAQAPWPLPAAFQTDLVREQVRVIADVCAVPPLVQT